MFVITRRFSKAGVLVGAYRLLRVVPWVVAGLFVSLFFFFGPRDLARCGEDRGDRGGHR